RSSSAGARRLNRVGVARAVKPGDNEQKISNRCPTGERVRYIGIWPTAPGIAESIVDVSAGVGDRWRSHRRVRCELRPVLTPATKVRVASTDQILICADGRGVRSIDGNGHRRHCGPGIGYNVILVMIS